MIQIEQSLLSIRKQVKSMTKVVSQMVETIHKSIKKNSAKKLNSIQKLDRKLDLLEKETDQKAIELLALINPRATDLRYIFSIIKLDVDLERIGDECKNIVKEIDTYNKKLPKKLSTLSAKVLSMVELTFTALINTDVKLARKVIIMDNTIDAIEYEIISNKKTALNVAFMARSLERIADHATNIAEKVIFTAEGVDINHSYKSYGLKK